MTAAWEPPADFDPTAALIRNLAAKAAGEPTNEDEIVYASSLLACGQLVRAGVDIDKAIEIVERLVTEGQIHVAYDTRTEELSLTIGEEDPS